MEGKEEFVIFVQFQYKIKFLIEKLKKSNYKFSSNKSTKAKNIPNLKKNSAKKHIDKVFIKTN
jgi:hypothetical protein